MASANIVIQQNDGNQISQSRDDLVLNVSVTLFNASDTGVTSWIWQIVDKPFGSAAVLSSSIVASPTFTPDVEGTYLIKLTVNHGIAADQKGAAVKTINLHYRIPAASEEGDFDPVRGWADAINDALEKLDDGYGNLTITAINTATLPLEISNGSININTDNGQIGGGSGSGSLIWSDDGDAAVVAPDGHSLAVAFNGGAELFASDGSSDSFIEVQPSQVSIHTISTNIAGDVGMSTGKAIRFETIETTNWSIGKNLNLFTRNLFDTDNSSASLDVVIADSLNQGFAIGQDGGVSVFEVSSDGYAYLKNSLFVDGYVDRFSAGSLNIGPNNATGGTIGNGETTGTLNWGVNGLRFYSQNGSNFIAVSDAYGSVVTGLFNVIGQTILNGAVGILQPIDTFGPSSFQIAATNAIQVDIARAGILTGIHGNLAIDGYLGIPQTSSLFFNSIGDFNWRQGVNLPGPFGDGYAYVKTNVGNALTPNPGNTLDIIIGTGTHDGFTIGNADGYSVLEIDRDGILYVRGDDQADASIDVINPQQQDGVNLLLGGENTSTVKIGTLLDAHHGLIISNVRIDPTSPNNRQALVYDPAAHSGTGAFVPKDIVSGVTDNTAILLGAGPGVPIASNDNFTFDGSIFSIAGQSNDAVIQLFDGETAAISFPGAGRIRYNTNTQHFEISENGGSYIQLSTNGISGSIANTQVAFGNGTSITGNNNFTYDGSDGYFHASNLHIDSTNYINFANADIFWHMGQDLYNSGQYSYTRVLTSGHSLDILLPGDGEGFTIGAANFNFQPTPTSIFEVRDDGYVFIKNALSINAGEPEATLDVNGNINAGSGMLSPSFDQQIGNSAPLNIGAINATSINIGNTTNNTTIGVFGITARLSINPNTVGMISADGDEGVSVTNDGPISLFSPFGILIDGYIAPVQDAVYNFGDSTKQWQDGYFAGKLILDGYKIDLTNGVTSGQTLVYDGAAFVAAGGEHRIDSDGNIIVDSTLGDMCILSSFDTGGGNNGNILSITITNGLPGQILTLDMFQGNVAYTWPTTISNARLAGGSFAKSTGAQDVDTITFRWNNVKTRWDEISRAILLS